MDYKNFSKSNIYIFFKKKANKIQLTNKTNKISVNLNIKKMLIRAIKIFNFR